MVVKIRDGKIILVQVVSDLHLQSLCRTVPVRLHSRGFIKLLMMETVKLPPLPLGKFSTFKTVSVAGNILIFC